MWCTLNKIINFFTFIKISSCTFYHICLVINFLIISYYFQTPKGLNERKSIKTEVGIGAKTWGMAEAGTNLQKSLAKETKITQGNYLTSLCIWFRFWRYKPNQFGRPRLEFNWNYSGSGYESARNCAPARISILSCTM